MNCNSIGPQFRSLPQTCHGPQIADCPGETAKIYARNGHLNLRRGYSQFEMPRRVSVPKHGTVETFVICEATENLEAQPVSVKFYQSLHIVGRARHAQDWMIRAGSYGVESFYVIPAKAGIQGKPQVACPWMPASAGMTLFGSTWPKSALAMFYLVAKPDRACKVSRGRIRSDR